MESAENRLEKEDTAKLIDRSLVRTKVIQTLYVHACDDSQTNLEAYKNLALTYHGVYDLYALLLDLVSELTFYAQTKIDQLQEVAENLHQPFAPELNFVNNRLAAQLQSNRELRAYLTENKLSWDAAAPLIPVLYQKIVNTEYYQTYMALPAPTYAEDKALWRKIFEKVLVENDHARLYNDILKADFYKSYLATAKASFDKERVIGQILELIKGKDEAFYNDFVGSEFFQGYINFVESNDERKVMYTREGEEVVLENSADKRRYAPDNVIQTLMDKLLENPFDNALEELELHLTQKMDLTDWQTDKDFVLGFVVKTIKRFKATDDASAKLLPMFGTPKEEKFGKTLVQAVLEHDAEYEQLLADHLLNWSAERLEKIDKIILKVAIAELLCVPEVPTSVTVAEYVNIAADYSSQKSPKFVNGILEEIIKTLKKERRLLKAVKL